VAFSCIPPVLLAVAAVTGLGLTRGVAAPVALGAAMCLGVLPILGLLSLARERAPMVTLLTAWLWCLLLLLMLPLYFPGERAPATASGLRLLAAPLGSDLGERVAGGGARLVSALGGDRELLPPAVPMDEIESDELSGGPEPYASRVADAADPDRSVAPSPDDAPVLLPYELHGGSLQITVDVDGPELGESMQMIFDTGATYTTLSHAALELLDIHVASDAPRITLRTANGEIEAPLVLIDAVWLGDAAVEWVTIAVCDSCASPETAGLLGLNVSGQFGVTLDHDRQRIELRPRRRRPNRRLDVRQWIDVRSTATVWWDGGVEIELRARNLSSREIRSAVIELDCGGDAFAVQLDDIGEGDEKATRVALPRGTDCQRQTLELVRATWRLDRF
jgi:predicted aspartyl protease